MSRALVVITNALAGADAHQKATADGRPYIVLSLATHRGAGDNRVTDWHDCLVFAEMPVRLARMVQKGDAVCLEGLLQYKVTRDKASGRVKEKHPAIKVLTLEVYRGGTRVVAAGPTQQAPPPPQPVQEEPDEVPPGIGDDEGPVPF